MPKDIYENGMYDELWELAHKLEPWFSIDKVKSYSVYVWTKDTEDEWHPFGENVFDIFADYLQFYTSTGPWQFPNEAMPLVKEIQEKLKEIEKYYETVVEED